MAANKKVETKRGLASFYLVAFATLIFGMVSLSFIWLILTESEEASNSDLSQSAYDSALAGIEDAKAAIVAYNTCLAKGGVGMSGFQGLSCSELIAKMNNGFGLGSCDILTDTIGRKLTDGEVSIQENYSTSAGVDPNSLNQAYTCVKINSANVPTYRSYLSSIENTRLIPVSTSDPKSVVGIQLEWHSTSLPQTNFMYAGVSSDETYPLTSADKEQNSIPPIGFELFQTDDTYQMYELDVNNASNAGTDHAMAVFYPVKTSGDGIKNSGTIISAKALLDASSKSPNSGYGTATVMQNLIAQRDEIRSSEDYSRCASGRYTSSRDRTYCRNLMLQYAEIRNQITNGVSSLNDSPMAVSCTNSTNTTEYYRCKAIIEFPATYRGGTNVSNPSYSASSKNRAGSTFLLKLSLPYGNPSTDFSITLCETIKSGKCTGDAAFSNLQAVIDSTGRASNLYRRVIAYVDLINTGTLPAYSLQTYDTSDDKNVNKNFYVTNNCWGITNGRNSYACNNNDK